MLNKIILAKPRGFCAGVVRAIDIVDQVLDLLPPPPPIYVRHEIVHNKHVVEDLGSRGAVFVDDIEEVPDGAVCIFSAHGVSPVVSRRAKEKHLHVIDATCPLVTKVHLEALHFAREGYSIILIGHAGHQEVEGTMGEAPEVTYLVGSVEDVEALDVPNPNKVAYTTQTTLSVDDTADVVRALQRKYPKISGPRTDDICYATQNRQNAVRELAKQADVVLVIGSENSSNSQRLKEVAMGMNVPAYLVDDESDIDFRWLEDAQSVGVTAGASAPEHLIGRVVTHLRSLGATELEELETAEENVLFALPEELLQIAGV